MRHWQFFFGIACVSSFYALCRLRLVRERGDVASRVILRRGLSAASLAAGIMVMLLRLRRKGRTRRGLTIQNPSTAQGHVGRIYAISFHNRIYRWNNDEGEKCG